MNLSTTPIAVASALDQLPWFAVQTRSHFEKVVLGELDKRGIDAFLPVRRVVRSWSDRKKLIEEPLFRGYVFLRASIENRLRALQAPGVVRYVGGSAQSPWEVPEPEMAALRRFVEEDIRVDPYPYLRAGQLVRVRNGPLRGLQGFIVHKPRFCRLVISVEMMMQSVAVEIDEALVEAL